MPNLRLNQIEITDLQARAATDDRTIAEYSEAWLEGEKFPPIIVFHDGKLYFLADGFHRYFGAKKAELLDINCDIRKGTRKDALWFAVAANRTHGLKRTNADKRRAVEIALIEKPEMADNAIAKHCGVNFHLVKDVRSHLRVLEGETQKPQQNEEIKRTGLDGKKYPAPPVRPPPPSRPPPPTKPEDKKKTPPVPKSKVEPEQPKDKTGWPIPEKIVALWDRATEIQGMLSNLSTLKGMLRKAEEDKDKIFAEVNFSSVKSHLEQAWTEIQTVKPFAVCPTCQGHNASHCVMCKGRGFISEFRWNHTVPRETKEIRFKAKKS